MFTGIVEEVGAIASVSPRSEGAVVGIRSALPLSEVKAGDSISVSGVCLTVVSKEGDIFLADVSKETLDRSTLKAKRSGDQVNLERALCLGGRLGGHLVYGHVDGTGTLRSVRSQGEAKVYFVAADESVMKYLVPKGSIAVDGVSLTVSALRPDGFEVTLIPATLTATTLGQTRVGAGLNLETDIIGKYVHKALGRDGGGVTLDFLKGHGFA